MQPGAHGGRTGTIAGERPCPARLRRGRVAQPAMERSGAEPTAVRIGLPAASPALSFGLVPNDQSGLHSTRTDVQRTKSSWSVSPLIEGWSECIVAVVAHA